MASLAGVNTNAAPADDFSPIPIGEYTAIISKDEIKTAKSGNGDYLSMTVKIVDGEYKNRTIFTILNLWNSNPKAKEIAERELSSIKEAVGVTELRDTSQLHNKPLVIRVGIDASGGYEPKNTIKGWKSVGKPHTGGGNLNRTTQPTSSPTSSQSGIRPHQDDIPGEDPPF